MPNRISEQKNLYALLSFLYTGMAQVHDNIPHERHVPIFGYQLYIRNQLELL